MNDFSLQTLQDRKELKAASKAASLDALQVRIARRQKIVRARKHLIDFTEFMMPDKVDPDNVAKSRYEAMFFHRGIADALEKVACGEINKMILNAPPRHGKSELSSRKLPAWFVGNDPYRSTILGAYNQPFSEDMGRAVRATMQDPRYLEVFPDAVLRKGSQASDRMETVDGGMLAFVGRGGSVTGRGGDLIILDDPIKNRKEADSATIRDDLWKWFNDDIMSRMMSDLGSILILQTRWHHDDIVGRLTDPKNPHFNEEEAKQWKIINFPAIALDSDPLGREPGEALWPERFGLKYLNGFKQRNSRGFHSLYQQTPSPEDGDIFTKDMIEYYGRDDAPNMTQLKVYIASDHAVSENQRNDKTCIVVIGVDKDDVIWVLDVWWKKAKSDVVVKAMIKLMKQYKPLKWWAEGGHISKAIGPFLKQQMKNARVYARIEEKHPSADKESRAQSIVGRMSMGGMVKFPKYKWWMADAEDELLKFPNAAHDDFPDALALIGLGLDKMLSGKGDDKPKEDVPQVGTLAWIKYDAAYRKRKTGFNMAHGGM